MIQTKLLATLYGTPMLTFDTALGETARPDQIDQTGDAWKLTGAWQPERQLDGQDIERWLLGLRPQAGARSAQSARAAQRLSELSIKRQARSQGDTLWGAPQHEDPGAVRLHPLADEQELESHENPTAPISSTNLEELLHRAIDEMPWEH